MCTPLCDKVCQWLATGGGFSPGPPVSFTNKTDRNDIAEILLKVALNTIKQAKKKSTKVKHDMQLKDEDLPLMDDILFTTWIPDNDRL